MKKIPPFYKVLFQCWLLAFGAFGVSAQTEMNVNGDFESMPPLTGWSTNDWGGAGTISSTRDTVDPISGNASAKIEITNTDPANDEWWHLNFRQVFNVLEGRTYAGTYTIRSDAPVKVLVQLIEDVDPFRSIAFTEISLNGTGEQTLRVVGSSAYTGTAHLFFAFGKTESPVTVWIDDVSVIQRAAGSDTAAVTVDFATPDPATPAPPDLSGLLLGLDIQNLDNPPAPLVTPLQSALWRVRPTTAYMEKVEGYGSRPIVLLSEGWYPGANGQNPTPWQDDFVAWQAHCTAVVNEVLSNANIRDDVIYDIWNEPDHPDFFTNWPDGTWANFLDTFGAAHDAIRAVDPDAIIAGPSTSADFPRHLLDQFMDAALARGWSVDILATHLFGDTDPSFEAMRDDIVSLRTDYIDNPTYAPVGVQEYMATEYANPGNSSNPGVVFRPGSIIAMLRFMEEAQVDGAIRSTWDSLDPGASTAFDGSLGGLIDLDTNLPRAIWWAMRWYALGAGNRVDASSDNPEMVPLASLDAGTPGESQLLLASRSYNRDQPSFSSVQLTLNGLDTAGIAPTSGSATLWIYRVANASGADPVEAPELLANPTVTVSGGSASYTISGIGAHDAVLVRFAEAESISFAPANTWSGAGGDNDLNTAANWGGGSVPAGGESAIWSGYEAGNLALTFSANVGGSAGWLLDIDENQTGNLTLTNASASTRNFRLRSGNTEIHEIKSGAGAVTLGTPTGTANPIQLVIGGSGGDLRINNNSAQPLIFGSNVSFASGGAQSFDLAFYGTGVTEIRGPFSTNTHNAAGWLRVQNGTVRLLGESQHAGGILVDSGVLEFDSGDAIGGGNFLRIGQAQLSGRIRYTGDSGASVSRTVSLGNGAAAGHAGQATIESDGAGALILSATPFNLNASQNSTVTRTLTLDGGSTAANTISGAINDNASGSGPVALSKTGEGTWVLDGANTYSGPTAVNQGTLLINGGTAAPSTVTVASGAWIGGSGTINGPLILADGAGIVFDAGEGLTANGGNVDLGNLSIARVSGLDATATPGTYTLIGGSAAFDFSSVENLGSANAAQLGSDRNAWFEPGSLLLIVADNYGLWAAQEELTGVDAEPTADPDGDGLSNQEEYVMGTDPKDSSSRYIVDYQVLNPSEDVKSFELSFPTMEGRRYSIETSATLAPDSWMVVEGPIHGDGTTVSFSEPISDNVFYRIRIEQIEF